MRSLCFYLALGLLAIVCNAQLEVRNPGDEIWAKCLNISERIANYNINIPNACIKLTEGQNCSVNVNFKIANRQVFDKQLDLTTTSRVCGSYSINQQFPISCNVCVSVADNPNDVFQQCVTAQPTCSVPGLSNIPLAAIDAGCFANDRLAHIEECRNNVCPAPNGETCANHGTCASGKCQCYNGWFGNDCSVNAKLFEKCVRVDQLSGDVCTRLIFNDCNVKLVMVVIGGPFEIPLYSRDIPVRNLGTVFRQDICSTDTAGCQACLRWSDLELTDTLARGCGTLDFKCQGLTIRSYPLGCFNDDQVVPLCFGTCLNDCSGHGNCDKGVCSCTGGWSGDDCSVPEIKCPKDCSGQGRCAKGVCLCNLGFYGTDCSDTTSGSKSHFNAAYVVAPLVLIAVFGAAVAGVWWYRKRRETSPRFNQFDLLEQDESDTSLTSGSIN